MTNLEGLLKSNLSFVLFENDDYIAFLNYLWYHGGDDCDI